MNLYDAIDVIESAPGFTDETTPVGEAWATVLASLSPPQPVPVSERLPGPEDCDAEGRCWWWRTDDADEWWELLCISDAREYNAGCGNARYAHWLPAHALPIPKQQENTND